MTRVTLATVFGVALFAQAVGAQPKPAAASKDAPDGEKLMQAVEDRDDGKDQQAKITLQITPKKGQKRVRQFDLLRKEYPGETKLITVFSSPADVRGAAFLVVDEHSKPDRRSIYLPAIGQVRKLTSSDDRTSFFASDFVYEELTNRDPEKDTHKFVAQQKVGQWECWVVDSKPKDPKSVEFASYRTWIWKDDPIYIRQEFYDKDGKVIRRGTMVKLAKVQGIWTGIQGKVENLKTGSTTLMEIANPKYNTGIADERFTEEQLSRGKL